MISDALFGRYRPETVHNSFPTSSDFGGAKKLANLFRQVSQFAAMQPEKLYFERTIPSPNVHLMGFPSCLFSGIQTTFWSGRNSPLCYASVEYCIAWQAGACKMAVTYCNTH